MLQRIRFFFSHAFFISICASALGWQSFLLAGVQPVNPAVLWLLFFCTLGSYNLYVFVGRFFSKVKYGIADMLPYLLLFLGSAVASLYFAWNFPSSWPVLLVASFLTLIYIFPRTPFLPNLPIRKMGFMKTLLLSFTWSWVTVYLPLPMSGKEDVFIFFCRFLHMLILCIIFDSRDASVDRLKGLNTLATDISGRWLGPAIHGIFLLYMASVTGIAENHRFPLWAAGIATYAVYRFSLKRRGYYFYYFLVDGQMLFSALLSGLATF